MPVYPAVLASLYSRLHHALSLVEGSPFGRVNRESGEAVKTCQTPHKATTYLAGLSWAA